VSNDDGARELGPRDEDRALDRGARLLEPMELVLVRPEIPQNTGCVARTTAGLGLRLHLVEPLGFRLEDRYLKRAGLDYWPLVDLVVHRDWAACARSLAPPGARELDRRLRLFSARGGRSLFDVRFEPDDVLVFGGESRGLAPELLEAHPDRRVYVPIRPGIRSLNLSSVVCLAAYVALVSAGLPLPENDGTYAAHPAAADDVWPLDVAQRARLG
jgi:tRNA (cytidine/uridine-2'-O-)-methyltransferase